MHRTSVFQVKRENLKLIHEGKSGGQKRKKSKTLLPLLVGSFVADETLAQPLQRQLRAVAVKATDFLALPEVPRIAFEALPEIGFLQKLRVAHPTATVLADARFLAGGNRFPFGAGGVVLGALAAEPDFRTGLEPGCVMTFDYKGHGDLPLERTEGGGGRGERFIALEQIHEHRACLSAFVFWIQDGRLVGGTWSIVSGRDGVEQKKRYSELNPAKDPIPQSPSIRLATSMNDGGGGATQVDRLYGRLGSSHPPFGHRILRHDQAKRLQDEGRNKVWSAPFLKGPIGHEVIARGT